MTTIQNYRDQQLQATSPRLLKLGSDYINLTSSNQYFKVNEAGTATPSSIEIKAGLVGALSGTVTFSVDSGVATITQSNNTCTIQYANMTSDVVTILATIEKGGNTYEARYTLTKVRDGAAGGYTLIPDLLSEVDVVATAADGTGYTLPTGNAVKLYQGSTIISGGVTYSVSAPATKNGLTASINATTGAITLSGASWTSDDESFTFVATYSTVPYAVVYSIAKSKAGVDAVIADLVSENDLVATANDGSNYTLPTGNSLRLYKGGAILSSGVTYSGTATKNGLTLTIDASTGAIALSGSSWSSNSESFVLSAAYSGSNYTTTYKITKAKAGSPGTPGTPGSAGPRGSVRLSGTAASAAWSDTTANDVLTNAGYATKVVGDIVTLTYSTTWTLTKFWDGSAWAVLSEYIDGNLLVAGTVAGNKIAANYVYAGSINANQITAGLITASQIDSRGLSIKDASGNIILAAGTALSTANISGLGTLATQNSVAYSSITGTKPPSDADKTSANIAAGISGQGSFATLSQITSANVSTYIASAAIGSAYIGDLSAAKITSGTMSAARISGGSITSSSLQVTDSSGNYIISANVNSPSATLWKPLLQMATASNIGVPSLPAIKAESYANEAIFGSGASSTNSTCHGVRGTNARGTSGIVGVQNGYDFYADGNGTNYGPFTGTHDALIDIAELIEPGDIVIDSECLAKNGVSSTLCRVTKSTQPNQKGSAGVLCKVQGMLSEFYPPAVFGLFNAQDDGFGNLYNHMSQLYSELKDSYLFAAMNALGEGQINVCGENGNLEPGDLIVSSSQPGKGMRQSDDIVRSYTVAKCREPVVFDYPTQVKMVACIYLCG